LVIVLDGLVQSERIKHDLRKRVQYLVSRGYQPGLGTLLVGDDAGSVKYVEGKHRDCAEVGIRSLRRHLPEDASMQEILDHIAAFNNDPECTGFIVQLPLPAGIDETTVIEHIDPSKDADGMHPYNLGQLVLHVSDSIQSPLPCTPRGIIALLAAYGIDLNGKNVCVVGRGLTVGRTIGLLLTSKAVNATVTLCHTGTQDVSKHMREADVVIAAVGKAGFVHAGDVKPGAVLVDVGVTRVWDKDEERWRIRGDIDRAAREYASAYTPNPGGVGPMTRAMLLTNVVEIAERMLSSE
jgi:methylenetetrahydrofolate dehydrogenase (NADP+) / methenyltetrahydrofolate cyclohydrolase